MEQPDQNYYDCVNPNLVAALSPIEGKRVLEIGCGAGRLGEQMKTAGAASWIGVEFVPEAAERARSRLDAVYQGDVESIDLPLATESFDYVVMGDVLEHLRDPWTTLRRFASLLVPTGRVVASIPNVGHATIIAGLLDGRWEYADSGLLDRTHLRFFTLAEIARLFAAAGLEFDDIKSIRATNPVVDAISDDLDHLRRKYKLGTDRFPLEARTFQWLVKARRAA